MSRASGTRYGARVKLSFREEELAFQEDVVRFIDQHWPAAIRSGRAGAEFAQRWFDALVAKGWSVPLWPAAVGGTDWTPTQKFIWEGALASAEAPVWDPCGAALVGPLLYSFGNRRQQARLLPPIRSLQTRWCHSFASRDPAQIELWGERRGDRVAASGRIDGVVGAVDANYLVGLVRTDPAQRPNATLDMDMSLYVVDLAGAGVTIDGTTVAFDEVLIDDADLIGEAHLGWSYAVRVLDHERTAVQRVTVARVQLEKLKTVLSRTPNGRGSMLDQDDDLCRSVADTEVQLASLEALELRVLFDLSRGVAPGPEAAVLSIKGGELLMRVGELIVESLGYYALPYPDEHLLDNEGPIGPDYALPAIQGMLFDRSWSAYSANPGADRDRVAEMILGPEES